MGKSTLSRLDVLASLGLLQYWERLKRLDWNVCSCPSNIVTIDSSKDTEKHIVDDEAVWFNIKLLTNTPIKDK